ncbi:hypothetical protein [Shinella sp.]|uniref:hypothetical protein n=1 Tax=Shinella sp. TaxID=1870904 RepID=UPI003D2764FA
MAIKSGFTAEDLAKMGPDELTRRKQLAQALLAKASGQRDIRHPLQGMAQMAEALFAGLESRKLDQAEKIGRDGADKAWGTIQHLLGGGQPSAGSTSSAIPESDASAELAATTPGSGGTGSNYRDAIASIESAGSGDYAAVGPRHPKMGRALGRYQVMESNIGPWGMEALGREVTPDEFLANPQIQDAIFDKQFGKYVEKYGPEGAAQAWFGGEGGVGKLGRKDSLGTSIGAYTNKFRNAMGGQTGQQEVASIDPNASLSQEVADFQQTPEYAGQFPGMDAQQFDQRFGGQPQQVPQNQQQLAQALLAGQQQGGGQQAIEGQMADPRQQQVAQALIGGQQQQGIDPALMEVLGNQYLDPQRRAIAQMLLEQQMQQRDPLRQMQLQKAQIELEQLRNPQQKKTNEQKNLEWRAEQAGLQPGTKEYADFMRAGGKGPMVQVNTGDNSSKFMEESDKKAADRLGTIVEEGAKAGNMLADMQQLADLGTQIKTGRGAEALITFGPYAEALGIDVEGLEPAQAYKSIVDRLAPNMRPAGSGATSDFDARQFLNSLPNLGNTPGANEIINQTFQAIAQNKMEASAIARRAQLGQMKWQDAEDQISKLPNPYMRFKDWQKQSKASEAKVPEGMDPADWEFMTPEEKRLFQ